MARLTAAERPLLRIRGYDYKGGAERLRHVIDAHGLSQWVRLEGPVAGIEKLQFLRNADAYVHPSRWECLGIALLENLALGVPCLVSSIIHIAPTLAESHAAVLAPPREDDLASALRRLASDGCEMAHRGRALIENRFNWKTLIPRFHAAVSRVGAC
jgi:glycosyltransferase involved in cell wall biosynthesis